MSTTPQWLGLLKWSLAHSDQTLPTDLTALEHNAENIKWLEEAMKELAVDDPKRMQDIMKQFITILDAREVESRIESADGQQSVSYAAPTEETEDKIETDLEDLRDIVEQIDMAKVFSAFGGVACLLSLAKWKSLPEHLRALAVAIIGTLSQNNIEVQDTQFKNGTLDALANLIFEEASAKVCNKAIFAVSCIARNHAAAETQLISKYLSKIYGKVINHGGSDIVKRIVFLSNALLSSDYTSIARIKDICDLLLPSIFSFLAAEELDLRETVQTTLSSILHTKYGWELLNGILSEEFDSALKDREKHLQNVTSSNPADKDLEKDIVEELNILFKIRQLMANLEIFYPNRSSVPDVDESKQKDEVLLIGP